MDRPGGSHSDVRVAHPRAERLRLRHAGLPRASRLVHRATAPAWFQHDGERFPRLEPIWQPAPHGAGCLSLKIDLL